MEITGDQIIFLLGAGASVEAGVPISDQMVAQVEELTVSDPAWQEYENLYNYLKSSIHYSEGIFGKYQIPFNVEKLLIVINEIEKRDRNLMYPFIGSWNIRLLDLAGTDFKNVSNLKGLIRKMLNSWVTVKNYDRHAGYYNGFVNLSREIGTMIKVFTFNYDLCFEKIIGKELNVETGFNQITRDWHYSNFENFDNKHYLLYKLHGSIDWYLENNEPNKLFRSDDPVENPELIFGIQNKLNSIDPYFFYTSEFRRATLEDVKLIITIGYSFGDDYANNILTQALNSRDDLRILSVGYSTDEIAVEKDKVKKQLNLPSESEQVEVYLQGASEFMLEKMNKAYLSQLIKTSKDAPF